MTYSCYKTGRPVGNSWTGKESDIEEVRQAFKNWFDLGIGIGFKELWEIQPEKHQAGLVIHTGGWPLDAHTYGGGFMYHMEGNQVSVGMVTGLGYSNPFLSPYEEAQRHLKQRNRFAALAGLLGLTTVLAVGAAATRDDTLVLVPITPVGVPVLASILGLLAARSAWRA